jgi:2'-5' RNA ligase
VIYVLTHPCFDPAVANRIARFRSAHEPARAQLVPPHITLVFGLASSHAPELTRRCRELAALTRVFTVTFASVERVHDPFEDRHKLFLICDTGADMLTGLHKRLYEGPLRWNLDPGHPFRPHMTVASHPDRAEIDRLDPASLGPLPITGQIHALDLVEVTDGTLRPVKTLPLLL